MYNIPSASTSPAIELGSDTPEAVVIILHGLGAGSEDLLPLAQALQPAHRQVRFILPNARRRRVTINHGTLMPAWYDIVDADFATERDPVGLAQSFADLDALIAQQRASKALPIVLIGFSQGGALALHTALRSTANIAGVAALSAYLPPSDDYRKSAAAIFMAHGIYDDVVPIATAMRSKSALETLGYCVDWHEYPLGHQLSPALIVDLSAWLSARLGGV